MIQKVQFKKITAVFVLVAICLSLVGTIGIYGNREPSLGNGKLSDTCGEGTRPSGWEKADDWYLVWHSPRFLLRDNDAAEGSRNRSDHWPG